MVVDTKRHEYWLKVKEGEIMVSGNNTIRSQMELMASMQRSKTVYPAAEQKVQVWTSYEPNPNVFLAVDSRAVISRKKRMLLMQ